MPYHSDDHGSGHHRSEHRGPQTPFDNIESSHEYVRLLAEAIQEAMAEVQADMALATSDGASRRVQALQLVHFNIAKLNGHIVSSRRILNDLRMLRRLLLDERSLSAVQPSDSATSESPATVGD